MERLTKRINGYAYGYCGRTEEIVLTKRYGLKRGCFECTGIVDRLAELEDKLENGIPFEPLCKVGDTVYQILKSITTPDMSIEPLTIVSAKFYEDAILYIAKDRYQLTSYIESTQFSDRWFLTHEEAEKRLEELSDAERKKI